MASRYRHRPNATRRTSGRVESDVIENLCLDFDDISEAARDEDDSLIRKIMQWVNIGGT